MIATERSIDDYTILVKLNQMCNLNLDASSFILHPHDLKKMDVY